MKPYFETDRGKLFKGDCLEVMRGLPDNHFPTIITDPPYLLNFMGKEFDSQHKDMAGRNEGQKMQAWHERWLREAYRILKPGGTLLAFGGSRTFHRLFCAAEDVGFVQKDVIMYLFGSGFPKSTDISKQIDKAAGKEREIVGTRKKRGSFGGVAYAQDEWTLNQANKLLNLPITAPATPEAELWNGYGTALKPAYEPILVCQKPNDGTYAANALKHGVAGLNIDGGRIKGTWSRSTTTRHDMRGGNFKVDKPKKSRNRERARKQHQRPFPRERDS